MAKGNGKDRAPKPMFTIDEQRVLRSVLEQKTRIEELPISSLEIDYSYQTRKRDRIKTQIISNFSEALLGVLKVARRPDGSYKVMDGVTRVEAIQARGEKQRVMRCELFEVEGVKQEALLFAWFNSKRSHEPIKLETRLQAEMEAGTDRGFGKLIYRCDFTLVGGGVRHLDGPHYALQSWALDDDGTALEKTLFALKSEWRDKHKHKIPGYFIHGIARLYYAYRARTIDDQVRRILNRKSPEELWEMCVRRYTKAGGRALRIHPDERPKLISTVLALLINKNPGKTGTLDLRKLDEDRLGA